MWRLVEAGWRCRYEPASVVHHAPAASWRALVSQRVAYGSSAAPLARRHRGALAPAADERMERRRVGAPRRRPAGRRARARRRDHRRARAQAPRRAARRVPAPRRARPPVRRAQPRRRRPPRLVAAAPRRRARVAAGAAGSPRSPRCPALLDGGVPRLVDDLAYGAGVWKGVIAERDPAPLVPEFKSWPGRSTARRRGRRVRSADVTPAAHRRHAPRGGRHVDRVVRRSPGLVPVVKGNGYGFGRPALAEIAAEFADTRRRRHGPRARRPARPAHARRAHADAAAAARHPPDPHRRLDRPRQGARRLAGPGAGEAGLVDAALRHRAARTSARSPGRRARRGLDIVGFSVHPPLAGTDDEHADDIAAWLTVLDPDDEVWVSHLSLDGYAGAARRVARPPVPHPPGTALWHGDKSALHLGADVLDVRPVRAGELAGYHQVADAGRRAPGHGRRRHRPRRAPAPRRAQPVPLRASPAAAARAAAHAHVDGRRRGRRSRAPTSAITSTCSGRSSTRSSTRCAGGERRSRRRPADAPWCRSTGAGCPGPTSCGPSR